MNQRYLPSKRIWILIGVILVISGGLLVSQNTKALSSFFAWNNSTTELTGVDNSDPDEDGLANWEEKLWGTNPNDPDTDGDGTKDGDEVAQNRDPLDDSEDDSVAEIDSGAGASPTRNVTANIQSSIAPRALILAMARQEGEDISDEDIARVARGIASTTEANNQVNTVTENDLNITQKDDEETVREYLSSYSKAFEPMQNENQPNPISVTANAFQNETTDTLNLTPYIRQHRATINNLKEVTVPERFVEGHVNTTNGLKYALNALIRINNAEEDPLGAVVGVQQYKRAIQMDQQAGQLMTDIINTYAESL